MKNLFKKVKMNKELNSLKELAQANGWETVVERRPLTDEEIENTFIDYVDEYGFNHTASLAELSTKYDLDKIEVRSYEW